MVRMICQKVILITTRNYRVRRFLYFGLDTKWRNEAEMEYIEWKTAKKRVGEGVMICILSTYGSQITHLDL